MPGKLLCRFSILTQFYCLAENITKLTALSELLCHNATAVSSIMKVYHSSIDISNSLFLCTSDTKHHLGLLACEGNWRL